MCHTKNDSIYFLRHNQIEACCFISCTNKTLYEAFSIRYSGGMRTIRMRPKHIERSEGTFRAIERGIRCESGAVPAAVILIKLVRSSKATVLELEWEGF